jgi:hypothetical protein
VRVLSAVVDQLRGSETGFEEIGSRINSTVHHLPEPDLDEAARAADASREASSKSRSRKCDSAECSSRSDLPERRLEREVGQSFYK